MQTREDYEKQINSWIDGSVSNKIIDQSFDLYKSEVPEGTKESFRDSILLTLFPESKNA